MNVRRLILGMTTAGVLLIAGANTASAAPLLQLDIVEGRYDWNTKTVVATSDVFTLVATFTRPDWMWRDDAFQDYLNDEFYIAAAVSPRLAYTNPSPDLGSFTFNGTPVQVTEGMLYGNPPAESTDEQQPYDTGDLDPNRIYDTYFQEFAFYFDQNRQTTPYDSQYQPGGFAGDVQNGGSYYAAFTIDVTALQDPFVIHFDLYSTKWRQCATSATCTDEDLRLEADVRHDAQSAPVPEPGTLALLGGGLGLARLVRRRREAAATQQA